jgi:hypothetical protein
MQALAAFHAARISGTSCHLSGMKLRLLLKVLAIAVEPIGLSIVLIA